MINQQTTTKPVFGGGHQLPRVFAEEQSVDEVQSFRVAMAPG